MNIGVMLRHLDQHGGGVLVYTRQLLDRLFSMGLAHTFTVLYHHPRFLGTYASHENVREVVLRIPTRLGWDQLAVPWLVRREKIDVLFNPKYSLPLLTRAPAVFVCHGLDWYVMPWGSTWIDRLNHRYLMPRFVAKSSGIIAVSNATRQHFIEHFGYDAERVVTVYLGVSDVFRRPVSDARKASARDKYRLPDRYVLYVGQIYPAKNFTRLLEAYAAVGPRHGVALVVAGQEAPGRNELAGVDRLGIRDWVVEPGWIEHDELPALYHMADALLMPSLYEACPSPILEAMCCGCPIVTANRYGTLDLAGDAAVLVDPESVDDIARGLRAVLTDGQLRTTCVHRGLERVTAFGYDRCALETLEVLEQVGARDPRRPADTWEVGGPSTGVHG